MERRINYLANKEYQMKKTYSINLFTKENKFEFIINIFTADNRNTELIKFCLFYLRELTCFMDNTTMSLIEKDLIKMFDHVIGLFFNSKDKQIMVKIENYLVRNLMDID